MFDAWSLLCRLLCTLWLLFGVWCLVSRGWWFVFLVCFDFVVWCVLCVVVFFVVFVACRLMFVVCWWLRVARCCCALCVV